MAGHVTGYAVRQLSYTLHADNSDVSPFPLEKRERSGTYSLHTALFHQDSTDQVLANHHEQTVDISQSEAAISNHHPINVIEPPSSTNQNLQPLAIDQQKDSSQHSGSSDEDPDTPCALSYGATPGPTSSPSSLSSSSPSSSSSLSSSSSSLTVNHEGFAVQASDLIQLKADSFSDPVPEEKCPECEPERRIAVASDDNDLNKTTASTSDPDSVIETVKSLKSGDEERVVSGDRGIEKGRLLELNGHVSPRGREDRSLSSEDHDDNILSKEDNTASAPRDSTTLSFDLDNSIDDYDHPDAFFFPDAITQNDGTSNEGDSGDRSGEQTGLEGKTDEDTDCKTLQGNVMMPGSGVLGGASSGTPLTETKRTAEPGLTSGGASTRESSVALEVDNPEGSQFGRKEINEGFIETEIISGSGDLCNISCPDDISNEKRTDLYQHRITNIGQGIDNRSFVPDCSIDAVALVITDDQFDTIGDDYDSVVNSTSL